MLLQSLRALCKAPGGAASIWKYSEALPRASGVSGRFAYGFWTELHSADVAQCTEHEGQIWYQGKLYVQTNEQVWLPLIQAHHDTAVAGHAGQVKTFDLLDSQYYWKVMWKEVDQNV